MDSCWVDELSLWAGVSISISESIYSLMSGGLQGVIFTHDYAIRQWIIMRKGQTCS